MGHFFPAEIIKKKREKEELSREEIDFFVSGYTRGSIPDYQMSALLMAVVLNGMSARETAELTQIMIDSGDRITFPKDIFPVDKHSTGGVGDKTSLILAPIVASCGVPVPMMAGRGLGHTGGTIDKLESIPGYQTSMDLKAFKKQVMDLNLSIIGQTDEICPADKKIYGLRDVTATVESLPLICASIMSKKIAEGIRGLVLDVKFGTGAFMKSVDQARELATGLASIGKAHGVDVRALLTNMNQPLGAFIGNAVEIHECLAILKNEPCLEVSPEEYEDCKELSVELAAEMLVTSTAYKDIESARKAAHQALDSGQAYECFEKICHAQGGKLNELPLPNEPIAVQAESDIILSGFNTEHIGLAAISLGAGRKTKTDAIDPVAGIRCHKNIGDVVSQGEILFSIFPGHSGTGVDQAVELLKNSVHSHDHPSTSQILIVERIQ